VFDVAEDGAALEIVEQLRAAIYKAQEDVERSVSTLEERERFLRRQLEASPWITRIEGAKAAYDELKAILRQEGVGDPNEYGHLVEEKQRIEAAVKRLDALQEQAEALREKALSQLEQVKIARNAISMSRIEFLRSTLRDNPYVRMELIPYSPDARSVDRSLRDLLGAAEGKYVDDLYLEAQDGTPAKGLVADLMAPLEDMKEEPGKKGVEVIEGAIQALKTRLAEACRGNGDFGAWFNKFLKSEADKRPEYIDHILCWFPEDGLQVEYSRKGDGKDFQFIGQASAGQRAAAMLAFLLAHGDEPLVLDQPEDDLDNHLIYGLVVQQIRSNKLRRQLIIVTHNPNIVVNGDAELIYALDFNHQCHVKQTGSLQDRKMRKEVCQVMEGGEEAFERRYRRIGRDHLIENGR
jgi:hypothetical protein